MKKYIPLLMLFCGCHHEVSNEDSLVAIQIYDRNGLTETISNPDRLEIYEQIDFSTAQPYQKVLRVFRKEGKNYSKITTYHPNRNLWQYLEAEEMRAHGAYKEWHPNGVLKIEATVIGGTADVAPGAHHDWLFDDISRVWNEKGTLIAELSYQKGALQGKSLHYYESGTLKKELPYINHRLEGEGTEYHSNGSIKAKIEFKNDLKDGSSLGYFEGGEVCWVETWVNGGLERGLYFNAKGDSLSEIKEGLGFQVLFEQGIVSKWIEIQNGQPEGLVKNFTPNGDLQSTYQIKEGKKSGEELIYYPKKGKEPLTPKMKIHWDGDAIHGIVRTWYKNGQLQSEREYGHNKKVGSSIAWYPNGSLMLIEEYENDTLLKGRYYKKGSKDPVSAVQNGNGVAHLYDEEGILIRKVQYQKGKALDPEN